MESPYCGTIIGIPPTAGAAKENFVDGPAFLRDYIILYNFSIVSGSTKGPTEDASLFGVDEAYWEIKSSNLRLSKYDYIADNDDFDLKAAIKSSCFQVLL